MRGHKALFGVAILAVLGGLPQAAMAGPPLICHAIQIGQAKSLPWSANGWNLSGKENYDVNRLVDDTLSLLGPSMPVVVRMETLRRATLYAQRDPIVVKRLLFQLRKRALDSDANGQPDALAWFDYGYLTECYKQTAWMPGSHGEASNASALVKNFDGYAAVEKAIGLRGKAEDEPQMEFAAALIGLEGNKPGQHAHAQKAIAGANQDALLAGNLKTHFMGDKSDVMGAMLTKTTTAKN